LEKLLQTALDHHKFIYIRQGTIVYPNGERFTNPNSLISLGMFTHAGVFNHTFYMLKQIIYMCWCKR